MSVATMFEAHVAVKMTVNRLTLFSFCHCRLSKPVTSLPLVSEVFPTLRTVLEALNVQLTEADCKDVKSVF